MNLQLSLIFLLEDCTSISDLCAGTGNLFRYFNGVKVGYEINPKYKEQLIKNGYKPIIDNLINISKYDDTPDAVTWIDGIEHFNRDDAITILDKIELIARKKIIIFTPNEFIDNKENATKMNEPYQEHLSVFPKEFWLNRGYKIVYEEENKLAKVNNILYVKDIIGDKN